MNDTTRLEAHPEVEQFVAAVRVRFVDLGDEEGEELLAGWRQTSPSWWQSRGVRPWGIRSPMPDELHRAAGSRAAQSSAPAREHPA